MKLPGIQEKDQRPIGKIDNYQGCLHVIEKQDHHFWTIDDGNFWEEIPKTLYDELLKFEANRKKEQT